MRILYLPNCYSQQRQREKKANIYPVLMAMEAQKYRREKHEVYWGIPYYSYYSFQYDKIVKQPEGLPFLTLPHPDRVFTKAKSYTSGNYKYLPGTHIQVANGCWHGRCSFCVEQNNKWEVRGVDDVINEIDECRRLGFREVFDDSGTFPVNDGLWLSIFLQQRCKQFRWEIPFSCNMRMVDVDYERMKEAGFRMLLFGLESANQQTLDKIQKGTKVEDVKYIIKAAKCGLEPHITVMFGYPWETDKEALNTLQLVHYLLRKGYAKTAQASLYRPIENSIGDKDREPNYDHQKYIKRIYQAGFYLDFWWNKLKDIHNRDDLKYLWRQLKVGLKEI